MQAESGSHRLRPPAVHRDRDQDAGLPVRERQTHGQEDETEGIY